MFAYDKDTCHSEFSTSSCSSCGGCLWMHPYTINQIITLLSNEPIVFISRCKFQLIDLVGTYLESAGKTGTVGQMDPDGVNCVFLRLSDIPLHTHEYIYRDDTITPHLVESIDSITIPLVVTHVDRLLEHGYTDTQREGSAIVTCHNNKPLSLMVNFYLCVLLM